MPCTSPKGFSPCPCVLVVPLSSMQHHMALAVLHYWCFLLPQSMYAQQNCAEAASCLAKATSETLKQSTLDAMLFLSRRFWASEAGEVAHTGERSGMGINRNLLLGLQSGAQQLP